jgi:mRNA-degrading endonuclease toxin of MazEF toxin-antitoxin module
MSQWIIVPTSASARAYIFRPEIDIPGLGSSRALCDAAVAIDPEVRLGEQLGHLTLSESIAVDYALNQILDLP